VIGQDKAAQLLDDVLYTRVMECVDLRKLLMVEIDLWASLSECVSGSEKELRAEAKAMIDRVLARFAHADDRYDPVQPFGMHCDLCEEEAVEHRKKQRKTGATTA